MNLSRNAMTDELHTPRYSNAKLKGSKFGQRVGRNELLGESQQPSARPYQH